MPHYKAPFLFLFQSTPSARRATDRACKLLCNIPISIHALREEGDGKAPKMLLFSARFQSTPSARRATDSVGQFQAFHGNFNPRPPRGERPIPQVLPALLFAISIHALREESDRRLSSHSCRTGNFNPRPPRGERHQFPRIRLQLLRFQSTPSARRATTAGEAMPLHLQISIHALREEGDRRTAIGYRLKSIISIHALREEGDKISSGIRVFLQPISIHALREEGDSRRAAAVTAFQYISIHALREEGDTSLHGCLRRWTEFQSTPSARRATHTVLYSVAE